MFDLALVVLEHKRVKLLMKVLHGLTGRCCVDFVQFVPQVLCTFIVIMNDPAGLGDSIRTKAQY